jgi:hypothetical protein
MFVSLLLVALTMVIGKGKKNKQPRPEDVVLI